jgi:hypothetical protein
MRNFGSMAKQFSVPTGRQSAFRRSTAFCYWPFFPFGFRLLERNPRTQESRIYSD